MAFCFPRGSEDFVTIIAFLSVDVFQKEDSDSSREISFCYWTELGSTAKTIYWHCVVVRESTAFIAKKKKNNQKPTTTTHKPHTRKKYGQLMFKRPELPNGFQRGSQGMWSTCAWFSDQLIQRSHGDVSGTLISGGLGLQQLEAGLGFPGRVWGQVVVRALNPSH